MTVEQCNGNYNYGMEAHMNNDLIRKSDVNDILDELQQSLESSIKTEETKNNQQQIDALNNQLGMLLEIKTAIDQLSPQQTAWQPSQGISERKLRNTLSVARECERIAKDKNMSKAEQNACFVMGFLHDIGYEQAEILEQHPQTGYQMLCDFMQYHYEILHAIRDHGCKYDHLSKFDEILNMANLMVDHEGQMVGITERLKSIKDRHGKESTHYQHAKHQAYALGYHNAYLDI